MRSKAVYRWLGVFVLVIVLAFIAMSLESDYKVIVEEQPTEIPKEQVRSIIQYIPLVKDQQWIYSINDNEDDQLLVSVDFLKDNVMQLRFDSDYKDSVKVYTYEKDGFYEVATIDDVSYKVDHTNTRQYKKPVLKLPLEEGSSWQFTTTERVSIERVDYKHSGNLGEIKALEVTYRLEDKTVTVYFGEKIGVLELEIKEGLTKKSLQLQAMETSSMITELVNVYYVNTEAKELEKVIQEVKVRTNEEPKHFLTDLLKITPAETYLQTLPTQAVINNIYYDQEEDTVYVDLTEAYINGNREAGEQKLADLSVIKTLGDYYKADYIKITIAGNSYQPRGIVYDEERGIEVGRY